MRGIGFTVQTTEPQSASCSTTCTAAGVCGVCACAVCLGRGGGMVCVGRGGDSQDPFYRAQEAKAEIRVSTSRKCDLSDMRWGKNFFKTMCFLGWGRWEGV